MATTDITPRVQQALDIWDGLSPSERNYRTLAEVMNITEGRAGVYLRDALKATGRLDEAPRGGKGNGTGAVTPPATPTAMIEAAMEQTKAAIEQQEARVTEARTAADAFEPDEWKAQQEKRLGEAVKAAQAALKAFRDDEERVATEAAEAEAERLRNRAEKVSSNTEQQVEQLRESLEGYEVALKALAA